MVAISRAKSTLRSRISAANQSGVTRCIRRQSWQVYRRGDLQPVHQFVDARRTPLHVALFDSVLGSRSTDTLVVLTKVSAVAFLTLASLMVVRGRILVWIGTWIYRRIGGSVWAKT